MTLTGYLFGIAIDNDLYDELATRGVKETCVQLSWVCTARVGSGFPLDRFYQIKLYETLRENGKPAYFPDVIVDRTFGCDGNNKYLDCIALRLLEDVATYLSRHRIKTKVEISKHFFEDSHFAFKGAATEVFDRFRARGLEACFIEDDANKIMWVTYSGGK